jgi:sucrose-6-phosphate hydrolase SacC (GH32 family)
MKKTWKNGGGNSNFSVKVLAGEKNLSLRILVDRPIIEVFAQGGRGALVAADQIFTPQNTSVYLFNGGRGSVPLVASMYGMGCGWAGGLPAHRS